MQPTVLAARTARDAPVAAAGGRWWSRAAPLLAVRAAALPLALAWAPTRQHRRDPPCPRPSPSGERVGARRRRRRARWCEVNVRSEPAGAAVTVDGETLRA